MKRTLVTGGAGFIGSHLVEALVQRGDKVRVLDDFSSGKEAYLAGCLDRIQLIKGDIRDSRTVRKAVQGIEYVFHQAALRSVPRSVKDPQSTNEVNVQGTLALLLASRAARVKRLVYASSSSVYGDSRQFPQRETQLPHPVSPYAASKLAGEHYCQVFSKTLGLPTVALRYFNVFGPRQDPYSEYAAVVPRFILAALKRRPLEVHGDGYQSRDFTYVANVVQANLLAGHLPYLSGRVFNVGGGRSISVLQIIKSLEQVLGRTLPRRHTPPRAGDVRKTWSDRRQGRQYLRYRNTVGFSEGLKRTLEFFAQRPPVRTPPS